MKRSVLLGGLIALALAGCEDRGQSPHTAAGAPTPAPTASSTLHPALAATDQDFMAKAAGDNAFQLALARTALQQSHDPGVRALAQDILRDHTRMNAELAQISTHRHTERPSPPVMVRQIEDMQAQLGRLQGEAFRQAFAGMMVADHRRAISMFENEIRDGHDRAVSAFASTEIDTLREHLKMAGTLLNGQQPSAAHS
jgi:putative membrane protein